MCAEQAVAVEVLDERVVDTGGGAPPGGDRVVSHADDFEVEVVGRVVVEVAQRKRLLLLVGLGCG